MSRADYVNAKVAEDAHGEVLAEQAHNELAAAGTPEAGNRNAFTGPVYDTASQEGAANATVRPILTPPRARSMRRVGRPASRRCSTTTKMEMSPRATPDRRICNIRQQVGQCEPATAGTLAGMTAGAAITMARMMAAWALLSPGMGVLATGTDPAPILQHHEVVMSDRTPLAKLVEPINAEVARLIRDQGRPLVERLDTPFLPQRTDIPRRVAWAVTRHCRLTIGYARQDNFTVSCCRRTRRGLKSLVEKAGAGAGSGGAAHRIRGHRSSRRHAASKRRSWCCAPSSDLRLMAKSDERKMKEQVPRHQTEV